MLLLCLPEASLGESWAEGLPPTWAVSSAAWHCCSAYGAAVCVLGCLESVTAGSPCCCGSCHGHPRALQGVKVLLGASCHLLPPRMLTKKLLMIDLLINCNECTHYILPVIRELLKGRRKFRAQPEAQPSTAQRSRARPGSSRSPRGTKGAEPGTWRGGSRGWRRCHPAPGPFPSLWRHRGSRPGRHPDSRTRCSRPLPRRSARPRAPSHLGGRTTRPQPRRSPTPSTRISAREERMTAGG